MSRAEEKLRKKIFMENKNKVAEHNQKYERGEVPFKLNLNKYSDMPADELRRVMNGFNGRNFT